MVHFCILISGRHSSQCDQVTYIISKIKSTECISFSLFMLEWGDVISPTLLECSLFSHPSLLECHRLVIPEPTSYLAELASARSPRTNLFQRIIFQFYQLYSTTLPSDYSNSLFLRLRYDAFFHEDIDLCYLAQALRSQAELILVPSFLNHGINDMSFATSWNGFNLYKSIFPRIFSSMMNQTFFGCPEPYLLNLFLENRFHVRSVYPKLPFSLIRTNGRHLFLNTSILTYQDRLIGLLPIVSGSQVASRQDISMSDFSLDPRESTVTPLFLQILGFIKRFTLVCLTRPLDLFLFVKEMYLVNRDFPRLAKLILHKRTI